MDNFILKKIINTMINKQLPTRIKDWLNARGITDGILQSFDIHWNGSQIVIPVHDKDGKVLFNKYRRDPESKDGPKYKYEKGATSVLYGITQLSPGSRIVICEGELDALRLLSDFIPAVSSTGGASTFQARWQDYFVGTETYICLDTDDAGIKGSLRIQQIIPWAKIIWLPKGVKDVTEYFASGKNFNDFLSLLGKAERYTFPTDWRGLKTKKELLIKKKEYTEYLHEIMLRAREKRSLYQSDKPEEILRTIVNNQLEELNRAIKFFQVKRQDFDKSRLERAKAVPITMFVKFNDDKFARCIWHNEKSGSMFYYQKQNVVHCFGCDKRGDVIDVTQKLNNCNLSDAIKILLNETR